MKNNKWYLIIVSCLLIIIVYFGYKAFCLLVIYDVSDKSDVIRKLKINDSKVIINSKGLENNQQYLEFKNIKIRNDFKNFKYLEDISDDTHVKYALYDDDGKIKAAFMMGEFSSYVELLKSDINIYGDGLAFITKSDISNIEVFLQEKNISNDIDLFRYIIEHRDDKNNIFTSIKKMKEKYLLYYMVDIMLPDINEIFIIDGMYFGYVFNLNKGIKEVSILDDDKNYVFTFIGNDYFTNDYINELISTVVING